MLQSRSEGKVAILFNSAVFTLLRLGCKKVAKAILKTANAYRLNRRTGEQAHKNEKIIISDLGADDISCKRSIYMKLPKDRES